MRYSGTVPPFTRGGTRHIETGQMVCPRDTVVARASGLSEPRNYSYTPNEHLPPAPSLPAPLRAGDLYVSRPVRSRRGRGLVLK